MSIKVRMGGHGPSDATVRGALRADGIGRTVAMTIWFTADHHLGHTNIIRFCRRPFADVAEMDGAMIDRWNAVVGLRDEIWHLGDFACRCGPNRIREVFACLRGRAIHLVRGNHDRKATLELPWASIQHYAEIVVGGQTLVLLHYAMRVWNRSHHGSLSLYGHSHGRLPGTAKSCDVGVDCWDYRPVALEEIIARMDAAGSIG